MGLKKPRRLFQRRIARRPRGQDGAMCTCSLEWAPPSPLWPDSSSCLTQRLGKADKSIAALPFDNLSSDAENAFFAGGLHDDVLTSLANIGDLKVISRASVLPYRNKVHNVREIGRPLGVSSILEGTVRRSGNRIRLVAQLIDARSDQHLWAQDYDRQLTDVFAIQSGHHRRRDREQLRFDPTWDALRAEPRFQKLVRARKPGRSFFYSRTLVQQRQIALV